MTAARKKTEQPRLASRFQCIPYEQFKLFFSSQQHPSDDAFINYNKMNYRYMVQERQKDLPLINKENKNKENIINQIGAIPT